MDYYIPPEHTIKQEQQYTIAYNAQDPSSWVAAVAYDHFVGKLGNAAYYHPDTLDLKKARGWIDLLMRLKEIIFLEKDFNKILQSDTPNLEEALKIKATIRIKKSDILNDFEGILSDVNLNDFNY